LFELLLKTEAATVSCASEQQQGRGPWLLNSILKFWLDEVAK
jgi:hypothetical protein